MKTVKKIYKCLFNLLVASLMSAVLATSCWEVTLPEETDAPEFDKTVTIGSQEAMLISDEAGATTFAVNTANIATSAAGSVQWYLDADGKSPLDIVDFRFVLISASISTGSADRTLTVNIGADSSPVTYYFRVTIDGVTSSNMGALVIDEKNVTIGTQSGVLVEYTLGMVTFAVNTTNIATSENGTVEWYNDVDGISIANSAPFGIETSLSAGSDDRILTVESIQQPQVTGTPPGTYYFRVTIDGVQSSNMGVLVVSEKNVTVGAQSNALISGAAGTTTFAVSTFGIDVSAAGSVQWYFDADGTIPIDAGQLSFVLISASVSTGSADRTLTVSVGPDSSSGTYYFRVTIDYIQSNVGELRIN